MLAASLAAHIVIWPAAEVLGFAYTWPLIAIGPALAAIGAFEATMSFKNPEFTGGLMLLDEAGWRLTKPLPQIGLDRAAPEGASSWYVDLDLLRIRF